VGGGGKVEYPPDDVVRHDITGVPVVNSPPRPDLNRSHVGWDGGKSDVGVSWSGGGIHGPFRFFVSR